MDYAVGKIYRHIVVLVGITHVKKDCLVHILQGDPGFQLAARIAVSTIPSAHQFHLFARHQIFDQMSTAVEEFPRIYLVAGIVIRNGGGAYKKIHRSKAGINRNLV